MSQAYTNVNATTTTTGLNNWDDGQNGEETTVTHVCSTCHGKGRIPKDFNAPQFGLSDTSKEKCNECGQWFPKSWGHTHVTCTSCHGKKTF